MRQCCGSCAVPCAAARPRRCLPLLGITLDATWKLCSQAEAGARTSPQVAEKAAPTLYRTRLRQAAARAIQLWPAILSTALRSHSYSRQSVRASTLLQGHGPSASSAKPLGVCCEHFGSLLCRRLPTHPEGASKAHTVLPLVNVQHQDTSCGILRPPSQGVRHSTVQCRLYCDCLCSINAC